MLDLNERPLRADGIAFVRLDGSMSQPAKDEALRRFATDADVRVTLLSLKAASPSTSQRVRESKLLP